LGLWQRAALLDRRQLRLWRRSGLVARTARWWRGGRIVGIRRARLAARVLGGARALLPRQLVDQGERLLELVPAALERLELGALARQRRDELLDLDVHRERDPAQVLDVLLALALALVCVHALY